MENRHQVTCSMAPAKGRCLREGMKDMSMMRKALTLTPSRFIGVLKDDKSGGEAYLLGSDIDTWEASRFWPGRASAFHLPLRAM